jgi:L-aminopeptidase/D-esterase-like protein
MARNLITDVEGVLVGSADDTRLASGVTVVLFEQPAIASIAMNGGAPALRDTALLEPEMTIERVDGFVLSGGSAFGLDAAGGVMTYLAEIGRGFEHRGARACSIFSMAGINPGAVSRPTGTWASKLRRPPPSTSPLGPQAPDLAPRPTISKADWAPPAQ